MTKHEFANSISSSHFATRADVNAALIEMHYTISRVASKADQLPLSIAVQVLLNTLAKQVQELA